MLVHYNTRDSCFQKHNFDIWKKQHAGNVRFRQMRCDNNFYSKPWFFFFVVSFVQWCRVHLFGCCSPLLVVEGIRMKAFCLQVLFYNFFLDFNTNWKRRWTSNWAAYHTCDIMVNDVSPLHVGFWILCSRCAFQINFMRYSVKCFLKIQESHMQGLVLFPLLFYKQVSCMNFICCTQHLDIATLVCRNWQSRVSDCREYARRFTLYGWYNVDWVDV